MRAPVMCIAVVVAVLCSELLPEIAAKPQSSPPANAPPPTANVPSTAKESPSPTPRQKPPTTQPPVLPPAPAPAPDEGGEPAPISWYQAHGWLMWLAYGVMMPVAIIVARYLQTMMSSWFHVHWILQCTAVACSVAAFAVSVYGFQAMGDSVHSQLGVAVFALTCFQPLFALIRPHKGVGLRLPWYALHWLVGMTAMVLGWGNIFTGLQLYGEDWSVDTTTLQNVFLASVGTMVFVYLVLGRWDYLMSQTDEEPMVDGIYRFPSSAHLPSMARGHKMLSQQDARRE